MFLLAALIPSPVKLGNWHLVCFTSITCPTSSLVMFFVLPIEDISSWLSELGGIDVREFCVLDPPLTIAYTGL